MNIPKIIHQTAPANENKWHPIWKHCQLTWKSAFPENEFTYMFWNDEHLYELIKNYFSEYLQLYNDFGKYTILKVDFARYAILYKYGGIYSDMDFMCKKNFYQQLTNNINIVESPAPKEIIQNSLMASPPNDKRWLDVLQNSRDFYYEFIKNNGESKITADKGKNIIDITGPRLLSRALDIQSINILPKQLFNPGINSFNSYSIFTKHYGTGKWGANSGNKNFNDIIYKDKDLYDIYNHINMNKNFNLDNVPEGYLVLECGENNSNEKILYPNIPLDNNTKIFVMDHQFNDKMIPLIQNNKLILKRVDGWGWGHNHHVYFTGDQLSNIQDISFDKNIEKNYIKIKIGKSDSFKKIVKLSVPLHKNSFFKTFESNLELNFNFTIDNDKNNILIVERTDKKEGWNKEFWISLNY